MKKAFTLLEIIMVIVILGIIGTISTDIIGTLFRNYNNQLVLNDLTLKTSNALDILTRRLDRSIKESIAYDDGGGIADIQLKLTSPTGANHILLWVGKDIESFKRSGDLAQNGYSGFIAVPSSDGAEMNATDSNASVITSIEGNITGTPWSGAANEETTALYFPYATEDESVNAMFYEYSTSVGQEKPSTLFPIESLEQYLIPDDMNITLSRAPSTIVERFYLTYSAYALKQEDSKLKLYYNLRPWVAAIDLVNPPTPPQTLIDNVTSFEYWSEGEGSVIRLKLCVTSDRYMEGSAPESEPVEFCKESAIIR